MLFRTYYNFFFLWQRQPLRSTRTSTLVPNTPLFRSPRHRGDRLGHAGTVVRDDDVDPARIALGVEEHPPAGPPRRRGETHRIVEQPRDEPRQPRRVAQIGRAHV